MNILFDLKGYFQERLAVRAILMHADSFCSLGKESQLSSAKSDFSFPSSSIHFLPFLFFLQTSLRFCSLFISFLQVNSLSLHLYLIDLSASHILSSLLGILYPIKKEENGI